MQFRPRLLSLFTCAAISALPQLASAQVLYSDTNFLAAGYSTSNAGSVGSVGPIRFNVDYSNVDIFGDGFLTAQIPSAPRSTGGETTGVFITANNNSFVTGDSGFNSIMPTAAAATNIGTGTANPNYVVRVDVFNSTGAGILTNGTLGSNGQLTTYSYVGINQANSTLQLGEQNAPSTTGTLTGQGMGLAITADAGAGDDFLPHYGGARYIDRALTSDATSPQFSQQTQPTIDTGLVGKQLANYWEDNGFEFNVVTPDLNDNLVRTTGDNLYPTPDPNDVAGWLPNATGTFKRVYLDAFPQHNDPLHLTGGGVTPPTTELAPNDRLPGGVPYNQWATHELYWVDGTFTYVVTYDGVTIPVLQITPDNDGLDGDDNIFSELSRAGAPVLAFYDRFDSIAVGPDGGNFVIYDNLEIEVADASDLVGLGVMDYLDANGYTLSAGVEGDLNGDGEVTGRDFLAWQRGETSPAFDPAALAEWQGAYNGGLLSAVTSVPEPSSLIILLGVAGCGLLARRQG